MKWFYKYFGKLEKREGKVLTVFDLATEWLNKHNLSPERVKIALLTQLSGNFALQNQGYGVFIFYFADEAITE